MKIDKTKSSSVRKAFGKALTSLGENNNKIVVMDSDLACSTQTKIFADKFPERFFDCGIAEQDMTATAAGLASEGKIPFIASFAVFATGRNYDQIRNGICYPNFNVKIVGTHGGITVGEDGATHQALEDISLMRGLPHMQVFIPADSKECEEIVKYAAEHDGPMYIRVPRGNAIDIFDENYKFDINKANILEKGLDIALFTNGETLSQALIAAEELKTENISISVINVPTIKPLDKNTIIDCAKESKLLTNWAKSGVLLLNTVLTVRAGQANSHRGRGWEQFTDDVIRLLNEREKPMVFLLWGNPAKAKRSLITNPRHLILTAAHPSPLSAYHGFFGCRHFSQTNAFLVQNGMEPIDWSIDQ